MADVTTRSRDRHGHDGTRHGRGARPRRHRRRALRRERRGARARTGRLRARRRRARPARDAARRGRRRSATRAISRRRWRARSSWRRRSPSGSSSSRSSSRSSSSWPLPARSSPRTRPGIPITKIAEVCDDPSRVVGMHWSNPPHLIPMIEVIPGDQTSDETVAAAVALVERIGYEAWSSARCPASSRTASSTRSCARPSTWSTAGSSTPTAWTAACAGASATSWP